MTESPMTELPETDVDVIVPVYNGAQLVARALTSILDLQTEATVRVHLIDDASTDGSLQTLHELASADSRVRVSANPRNVGVSVTRNRGIDESSAPFIAFLDQDDEWVPDKLSSQLAEFAADPSLDFVVGRQNIVLDSSIRPSWVRPEWLTAPQPGFIPGALIARREAFETIGRFDETMRHGGDDTDWFARARRMGARYRALDQVVLIRHAHENNLSSDAGASNQEMLTLVRRHVTERSSRE